MKEVICEVVPGLTFDGVVVSEFFHPIREVVRCKDCKWGEPTKNCYGEDRIICGNDDTYIDRYITVPADWFCADGERK